MKKSLIQYFAFNLKVFLFVNLLIGCASDKSKHYNDYEIIYDYFQTVHGLKLNQNIKKIFVLTENGCISCNRNFSNVISENINNKKSLFLIIASGTRVDISTFNKKNNVYFDPQLDYMKYSIFSTSKVIYFKDSKIDTIINIEAKGLEKILEVIKTRK